MKNNNLAFDNITLEGGLFVPELLERAAQGRADYQSDSDYHIHKGLKLQDEYGRAFQITLAEYQDFSRNILREDLDKYKTTNKFVYSILDVLDYKNINEKSFITCNDRTYPITADTNNKIAIVIAPANIDLDTADERFAVVGSGSHKKTPFHLAQEFLNASPEYLWAIVSNGRTIRLLRDSAAMTRPCYLEFDLEAILKDSCYSDFTGFWRILHASRSNSISTGNMAGKPIWEAWYQTGLEQGTRIRDGLRNAVTQALITIGCGFIAHQDNNTLREKLQNGSLSSEAYFQQLLRFIYRMLFLFTTEERGILHTDDSSPEAIQARKIYEEGYSQKRLRKYSLRFTNLNRQDYQCDSYSDLWQAQQVVFRGLQHGEKALELPALGGIFASDKCPDIDSASLSNSYYMSVIRSLRWYQNNGELSPVDYGNMGTEELGSVYESLLELVPYISLEKSEFGFVGITESGSSAGNARKTSGSYYTPDSLVQELIKSALDPVIEKKINDNPQDPIKSLLEISVIDPACGSGHFLLAAARRIAEKVAEKESLDGSVRPNDYRKALRKVIANCIYGVDLNPMAVELAKTALWLEGFEPGKPLGFIDNHILCGDSLLGIISTEQMTNGIPDSAYDALSGDDKEFCKSLKKTNREDIKSLTKSKATADLIAADSESTKLSSMLAEIEKMPEESQEDIKAKRLKWLDYNKLIGESKIKKAADLFIGAWLAPKKSLIYKSEAPTSSAIPTTLDLFHELKYMFSSAITTMPARAEQHNRCLEYCKKLCADAKVLHWPLIFENIFNKGGFDCVLANPPWEVSQLSEEEYFASRAPEIAFLSGNERKIAISELQKNNINLWNMFTTTKRRYDSNNSYYRSGGRFPLTAVGKVNTYSLFAETITRLISDNGRAGAVIPSGIATDNSTKDYFASIATTGKLVSLFDFENRNKLFTAVDSRMRFSLITLGKAEQATFAFFLTQTEQLKDERRMFTLSPDEFELINPNTLTCPIFRSKYDAELTKKIYRRVPVLMRCKENDDEESVENDTLSEKDNPWGIRFKQGLFNMTSASHLFIKAKDLPSDTTKILPLYEAKLMHQFDHRWARYVTKNDKPTVIDITDEQKADPDFEITPQYWVEEKYVLARVANVPDDFAKAYEKDDFALIGLLLANWLYSVTQVTEWVFNEESEDGKLLQTMLNDLTRNGKKSKHYLEKFQKKAADYPLNSEEINLIFNGDCLDEIAYQLMKHRSPRWFIGFRNVCRTTDERTVIASFIPYSGVGHSLPLIFTNKSSAFNCVLLASMNSLVFDYCARQKLGGMNLTFGYIKQFPLLPPNCYKIEDLCFIIPRVLKLVYTSKSMANWVFDVYNSLTDKIKDDLTQLGINSNSLTKPFSYNSDTRFLLRAELDAYYAKLYGLTREELLYVLNPCEILGKDYPSETFRVLQEIEIKKYGFFKTKDLILKIYDSL